MSADNMAESRLRAEGERLRLALAAAHLGDWSWDRTSDVVQFGEYAAWLFHTEAGPSCTWTALRTTTSGRSTACIRGRRSRASRSDRLQRRVPRLWARGRRDVT